MTQPFHRLSFNFAALPQPSGNGELTIELCVNGTGLSDVVYAYETACGFDDPAGGYAGLVPTFHDFGPLLAYSTGRPTRGDARERAGYVSLLGRSCGDLYCWPLEAHVVRWSAFRQPHRPSRNYGSFGPFEFELSRYEKTLRDLVETLRVTADRSC